MTHKIISLLIASSLFMGTIAEAKDINKIEIIRQQSIEDTGNIEGETIEHASLNPVYVEETDETEAPSENTDYDIMTTSDISDKWDSIFSL